LTVTLPADPGAPPEVSPPTFRAIGGARATVRLVDLSNGQGRSTVLRFPGDTPFQNPGNRPMNTVPLTPGNNVFTVRSRGDGVCLEAPGCKYDVVSQGREVLDPHVIIWQ